MPVSRNINRYGDVRSILDQALRAETARYTLPSEGKATNWRLRAYTFMRLAGEAGDHRYEVLKLALDGPVVIISRRMYDGTLELEGEASPEPEPEDELLQEALRLSKELKL